MPVQRFLVFTTILISIFPPVQTAMASAKPQIHNELILKMHAKSPAARKPAQSRQSIKKLLESHSLIKEKIQIHPILTSFPRPSSPGQFFLLRSENDTPLSALIEALNRHAEIEYVQFNHTFKTHEILPNDSLFAEQWGLNAVNAPRAWETTSGAPGVVIAIIDTGIDDQHPELQRAIRVNPGEDLNNNGVVDPQDFNGLDDDGNGFIDDLRGWDFTDAPNFVDGGDYLDRDNDPRDENGHGTSVAGIIAAEMNNGAGVAGLAPGCRIMNLRAGTSQGLLEEDDVAAAIVYAVQNGASIINMSFGDVVVSPFLRDIIQYAHAQGVVLIASAGNSASEAPHYPSAFNETISVGAIQQGLTLASFSNFGATVDLVAPGQQIWTTMKGGAYRLFSGTSAAAPFVSALAGLLLSNKPQLTPAQIKSLLTATALDLGDEGWDAEFGAGLIDAAFALEANHTLIAEIKTPKMDAGISRESVVISGTASGAFLASYHLSYRPLAPSNPWREIASAKNMQVIDDSLAIWRTENLGDGEYLLRLETVEQDGSRIEDKIRVFLDNSPPRVLTSSITPMIDGAEHAALIAIKTDDISSATLHWRTIDSDGAFRKLPFNFVTDEHRLLLPKSFSNGETITFFVALKNTAGLISRTPNDGSLRQIVFPNQPAVTLNIATRQTEIPAGFLFEKFVDLDQNGRSEILLSPTGEFGEVSPLKLFEKSGAGFIETFSGNRPLIPRDVGDSDGDGLPEILAGFGAASFIYEAKANGEFPQNLVWADSTNEFWAARFADSDGDGRTEIIARVEDEWQVWENIADNAFALTAALPNFTNGGNLTGAPRAEIGDFDGDGKTELLFGDFDGDIFIYEAQNDNAYQPVWSDSLPLLNTTDFIKSGDFNGDGMTDFAAASHTDPDLNLEHEFDARHWLVRIYQSVADDQFEPVWQQYFFGFFPPKNFDSGLGAGDLDGDGADELFLVLFPDLYVIKFQPVEEAFASVWHFRTARSNAAVIGGQNAPRGFFFNNGQQILNARLPDFTNKPPAPLGLDAFPRDEKSVQLRWNASPSGQNYRVYRGVSRNAPALLFSTKNAAALDTNVTVDQTYFYAVTLIDSSFASPESDLSATVAATPGLRPVLLRAHFVPETHLQLLFSEPLGAAAKIASNYFVDDLGAPGSAILASGGQEVILTFERIPPGEHRVSAANLADIDRTPLNPNAASASFSVSEPQKRFYLTFAEILDDQTLRISFNLTVDPITASDPDHFIASAPLQITNASPEIDDARAVLLKFAGRRSLAPRGVPYTITADGVTSEEGIPVQKGVGDVIGFEPIVENLERLFIYPNPFNPKTDGVVSIAGLPENSKVFIFDETGRIVRTLSGRLTNGALKWDGANDREEVVASGVYIVFARLENQKIFAKIAVIR